MLIIGADDAPQHWSPVHHQSRLAEAYPPKLKLTGTNAPPRERFHMEWATEPMARNSVRSLLRAFEAQLFDTDTAWAHFASLGDLRDLIRPYNLKGRTAPA